MNLKNQTKKIETTMRFTGVIAGIYCIFLGYLYINSIIGIRQFTVLYILTVSCFCFIFGWWVGLENAQKIIRGK